jgi:hypothetical protein
MFKYVGTQIRYKKRRLIAIKWRPALLDLIDFRKKWGIKQLAILLHQMHKPGMETKSF